MKKSDLVQYVDQLWSFIDFPVGVKLYDVVHASAGISRRYVNVIFDGGFQFVPKILCKLWNFEISAKTSAALSSKLDDVSAWTKPSFPNVVLHMVLRSF